MGPRYPETTPLHQTALAIVTGLPLLALCFVGARLYARRRFSLPLDWDDYVITIATLLSIGLIYPSYRNIEIWHIGFHIWEVDQRKLEPNYEDYHHIRLAYNIINTPILPLVKVSIILLLLKVSKLVTSVRRTLYGLLFFIAATCIGPWVAFIFLCEPRTGRTTSTTVFGGLKCLGNREGAILYIFVLVVNMFTDLLILPIPNVLMYRVQNITTRARMTVFVVSLLMLGATAIAGVRLAQELDHQLNLTDPPDWTYTIRFTLQHAENNVAIMLACMPMLRTLVLRWDNPSWTRKTGSENSSGFYHTRRAPRESVMLQSFDEVIDPPPERHVEAIACGLPALPPGHQQDIFDDDAKFSRESSSRMSSSRMSSSRMSSQRSEVTDLEFATPEPVIYHETGKHGMTRFYDSEPDF